MASIGSVSGSISSKFKVLKTSFPGDKYVFWQQSGCFARIYHQDGRTSDLYFEIDSCNTDKTITDVGGSFSLSLLPNRPWDELIQPDDFIRIFMGDQVIAQSNSKAAFNVASGDVSLSSRVFPLPSLFSGGSKLKIPLTGTSPLVRSGKSVNGTADRDAPPQLVMYERFFGKIDRCERIKSAPSRTSGSSVQFSVSGRGFGSILQDMIVYCNEHVPGLNAINIWYNSLISVDSKSPSQLVKEYLSVVLSVVPFPQWQLPDSLVKDYLLPSVSAANQAEAKKLLGQAFTRITQQAASNPNLSAGASSVFQSLVAKSSTHPERSPISLISLDGFGETYGVMLQQSFMNDSSSGVFDKIKYLSNAAFNEFWCDLCPNGDPEGGSATSAPLLPTFVMRQRPYNIVDDMLYSTPAFYKEYVAKLKTFPASTVTPGQSLLDLMDQGFTILGAVDDPGAIESLISENLSGISVVDVEFRPTLLEYQVGVSGHDRQNAFEVLPDQNSGQSGTGAARALLAENGGFRIDPDSITKYGFRILGLSTPYATPAPTKSQGGDYTQIMKDFSELIANWYFMNPAFFNGRMVCRFLPSARIGVPVSYIETHIRPDSPYAKLELSYCQGISDSYKRGQVLKTSVTVTRGIRYKLESLIITTAVASGLSGSISDMTKGLA